MEEISDSSYGNNCHKVTDNRDYSKKYKGVVRLQNGHWGAQLYINNQRIWLGTFYTEEDSAKAYDRALIMLRGFEAQRNFPWSRTTDLEAKFQSLYDMGIVLAMIKDKSYDSWFNKFLEKIDKENDDGLSVPKNCDIIRRPLFEKQLTPSDVGKLNRLVIPKKFAVAYFPPVPDDDEVILPFHDFDKKLWNIRYCYWKTSRSFVFTRGWNRFVKEKGLMAKDTIIFYYNVDLRIMEIEVKCLKSKEDGGIVEDLETSDEVIQTSNVETKGFKLFGVQIA